MPTGFTGLHTFPRDVSDPLYAIRRYLCLSPRKIPSGPLGPPILEGEFLPLITGETLIISEPWEDVPTPFEIVIHEPWEYTPVTYTETVEYFEFWSESLSESQEWLESWEYLFFPTEPEEWLEEWTYSVELSVTPTWLEEWEYSLGFSETQDWSESWEYSLTLSESEEWNEDWELSLILSESEEWTELWES